MTTFAEENEMTTFTLYWTTDDQQASLPMGEFETLSAARAAVPDAVRELQSQDPEYNADEGEWSIEETRNFQFFDNHDAIRKTCYRIYCEPKNGAQGLPHYLQTPPVFVDKKVAREHIEEMESDGIAQYWNLRIREV